MSLHNGHIRFTLGIQAYNDAHTQAKIDEGCVNYSFAMPMLIYFAWWAPHLYYRAGPRTPPCMEGTFIQALRWRIRRALPLLNV